MVYGSRSKVCSLFDEAKQRYESKGVGAGLSWDPYLIDNRIQDPETIYSKVGLMLYMGSTHSSHTKEAIKVYFSGAVRIMKLYNNYNILLL